MRLKFALTAAAVLTATLAPEAAQAYNFASDYGNAVFSYGTGTKSSDGLSLSFSPFSSANGYAGGCAGVAAFACITSGNGNSLAPNTLPAVGVNTSDQPISPYTLELYPGEVFIHPGADPAEYVILQFTAPITSSYHIIADFYGIDLTKNGNGTNLTTAVNGNVFVNGYPIPNINYDGYIGIDTFRFLQAGDTIRYAIDNNGEISYDSTAIRGSITAVPEPMTWAMMIAGFGVVGWSMRRRALHARYA